MSIKHEQSAKKTRNLILVVIGVVVVFLLAKIYQSSQRPTTPYPLPRFEKITWTNEKPASVYALLSPDTADEDIKYTEGVEITGEDTNEKPEEVFTYYDQTLTRDGFTNISKTGEPGKNAVWVSSYRKGDYYVEVQYYVTPENKDTKTSLVFSGILPR